MTKKELARKIAKQSGLSINKSLKAINLCFENIIEEISNNERIELRNFGIFSVDHLPARKLYNPYTGKLEELTARSVRFQTGKKDARERKIRD